jgi:hypothetical protein
MLASLIFLSAVFGSTFVMFYYGAVIGGWFKGPLLANFRRYGPDTRPSPFARFLFAVATWNLMMAVITRMLITGATGSMSLVFAVLMVSLYGGAVAVNRHPTWRLLLPRWYFRLICDSTRMERRHLAQAWCRIPARMRWRLNGDQAAFRVWVETVRLTMIYGAFDPNTAWDRWT